jgi:UDP-GlcNAc:undecaprenyl-phosphate GlcNAc-1-phosphate transferase
MRNLLIILVAMFACLMLTPASMAAARWLKLIDYPGGRKIHRQPTPLFGGAAIMVSTLLTALALAPDYPKKLPLVVASLLAFCVGLIDDWVKSRHKDLPALPKFMLQSIPALLLIASGVTIRYVSNPLGPGMLWLPHWLDIVLTFGWILGVTNAINFIDGADGLAAGVTGIGSLTMLAVAISMHTPQAAFTAAWSAALLGSVSGFLRHNAPPARIFMGDAGSNFLGFVLAAIALTGYFKTASIVGLAVPLLALALPIFNGFFVVLRRMRKGQTLLSALAHGDTEHAFNLIQRKGHTDRETVLICIVAAMICSMAALTIALAGM